jgi:hypothetical protein
MTKSTVNIVAITLSTAIATAYTLETAISADRATTIATVKIIIIVAVSVVVREVLSQQHQYKRNPRSVPRGAFAFRCSPMRAIIDVLLSMSTNHMDIVR